MNERPYLPRPDSAARQPLRHLHQAERALAELLRQLSELPGGPEERVTEHAWQVATDTAESLRSVAARLQAVEFATEHAPQDRRAALEAAVDDLRQHLVQGVDAYRDLIAAAGLLVAKVPVQATDELVEATEGLAALTEALRELSAPETRE